MAFIDLVADGPTDWYAHKYGENGQTIPSYIRQIKEWNKDYPKTNSIKDKSTEFNHNPNKITNIFLN